MSWLSKIKKGTPSKTERAVIYGLPGTGKTSAGCSYPNSCVIPVEWGLDALPDQPRFPSPDTWKELEEMIKDSISDAKKGKLSFQSLVIDTGDAAERLCWDYTAKVNHTGKAYDSIDAIGFAKGPIWAMKNWQKMQYLLDELIINDVNVVILLHSEIRKFLNPEGPDYERFVFKLHKAAASLWYEWASDVFFLRHDVAAASMVDKSMPGGSKIKVTGQSTSRRIVFTQWDGAYDAKHRIRLPSQFDLPDPMKGSFYDTLIATRKAEAERIAGSDDAVPTKLAESDEGS